MQTLSCILISVLALLAPLDDDTPQEIGLSAGPGLMLIENVEPGREYDVHKESGVEFTIVNNDSAKSTIILSTHRPSELMQKWEKGYAEIPDPSWVRWAKEEITIGPKSERKVGIIIKIPGEERYYNQHWIVSLRVMKKGAIGFGAAATPRVMIETRGEKIKGKPAGVLAFAPGTVEFENLTPGTVEKRSVAIYNNDSAGHRYRVSSLFAAEEKERHRRYITGTYAVRPDARWFEVNKQSFTIPAGRKKVLTLKVRVPDEAESYGKRWEELLLVTPDEGEAGFIRAQVETRARQE